jgi:hypothetical protein
MRNVRSKIIVLVLPLLLLAGCALTDQPQRLIQQPRLSTQNKNLLHAVARIVPKNARLIAPVRSNDRGKILVINTGGSGRMAALFFYQTDQDVIHIAVMEKGARQWHKIYDEATEAAGIANVVITNFSGHGTAAIFVAMAHAPMNQLNVYTLNQGGFVKRLSEPFIGVIAEQASTSSFLQLELLRLNTRTDTFDTTVYRFDPHDELVLMKQIHSKRPFDQSEKQLNLSRNQLNSGFNIRGLSTELLNDLGEPPDSIFNTEAAVIHWDDPFPMQQSSMLEHNLSIDGPMPAIERYYDSSNHFFIDLPIGTARKIKAVRSYGNHVTFESQDGSTMFVVYRFGIQTMESMDMHAWVRIGSSRQYTYEIPNKYRQGAGQVRAGSYLGQ